MRTLAVVLGLLIALGGGAFALSAVTSGTSQPSLTASAPPPVARTGSVERATATTAPLFPAPTNLTTELDAVLAGSDACLSIEDARGRFLYQHQATTPLIPASTQKLLVAEAALATLGPDYRFTTSVVAPAPAVNGQVAGLWLVGGGDPLLATPEFIAANVGRPRMSGYPWTPLSTLANKLVADGITLVPGGIRGDDSYEDQLRFLPQWPASYVQQEQIGLLSALSVNEGVEYSAAKSTMALDPPTYAASELARLLQAQKIPVGSAPDQTAPANAIVLASVSSAPLSQIVETMLRASDDWIAELLVRGIDKESGGTGTTAGGLAVVMRDAAQAGIPMSGVHMDDGSGLSRTDRATCREELAALNLGSEPQYQPVLDGLAIAGETGTLADRFNRTPIAGKLAAKTGSLDGVVGMVGIETVTAPVRFAFLDNDAQSETALYNKEDAVVEALATYTGPG